jgi:hypothetical protein
MLGLMRRTVGRKWLKTVLDSRAMPASRQTIPETIPDPGGDEAAAVERFRQIVGRFQTHQGPLNPSPLFGEMDYETLTQLNLIHCSHHLGFLIPKQP